MIITCPRDRWDYVLKAEREAPESEQTVFELGDLTERDRSEILDTMTAGMDADGNVTDDKLATRVYRVVRCGLRGWRNLRDAEGEVAFEPDGRFASDASLGLLPFQVKAELMGELLAHAFPQEADKEK